jgi:uracil phosphoribosyltransferase
MGSSSLEQLDHSSSGNFLESNSNNSESVQPLQPEAAQITQQTREEILNGGMTVENIKDSVHQITLSPELTQAFEKLRHGYPNLPLDQQTQGREFRTNSEKIIKQIVEETMENLDPANVVVLMPWRAGLAFANAYRQKGVTRFFHVNARRDEKSLKTIVDYEIGQIYPADTVIIADPMLATGNTAMDSIQKVLGQGVLPENIIINSVVAAPAGISHVKLNPASRIVIGQLDEKLNDKGFIVPGLGDFGDKYFHDFSHYEIRMLAIKLDLDTETTKRLFMRFGEAQ